QKPFHPVRLKAFFNESWPGVIRAKGFFWLATRPHHVGEMSQAGALVRSGRLGLWWASVPRQHWPQDKAALDAIARYSDPVWGDRRQELVFIGADPMDEADIRRRLDACLVDAEIFEPARWANLPDPFPLWIREAS
ncbi:MAG: GTP-binding protein, partial [Shinella sp.]